MKTTVRLLILLPLLCQGLENVNGEVVETPICDPKLQQKYCQAQYGGDVHTGCKYCGIGPQCPKGVAPSGRGLKNQPDLKNEILRRHNDYRADVRIGKTGLPATNCIPDLSWDDELAEVAQIWADQCANVIYFHASDIYPRIFHERGFERTTSRFNAPPGVGQNVAWALTKHVNFTRIIDDLWYRDINKLQPGRIGDFQIDPHQMDTNLVTQILWGRTTHVGCGWTQFPLKDTDPSRFRGIYAEGEYENFFVCNYGVGGNVPGEPVYQMNCSNSISTSQKEAMEMLDHMQIQHKERFTVASQEEKQNINTCLQTLVCLSQQSSADKSCSQLELQCVNDVPPEFPGSSEIIYFQTETTEDRVAFLECKLEAMLCLVRPEKSGSEPQMCGRNFEKCIGDALDYQYDDEDYENMPAPSIPESTSARIVLKSTTKTVVITTTPSTTTSMTTGGGGGASATTRASTLMTGSTSMDLDLITTQIPKLDIEVTTLRPAAARPASTTASTLNVPSSSSVSGSDLNRDLVNPSSTSSSRTTTTTTQQGVVGTLSSDSSSVSTTNSNRLLDDIPEQKMTIESTTTISTQKDDDDEKMSVDNPNVELILTTAKPLPIMLIENDEVQGKEQAPVNNVSDTEEMRVEDDDDAKDITEETGLNEQQINTLVTKVPTTMINETPTLADFIADTVADFLEKSEEEIPDEISIKIETKPNEIPEIAIEPNEDDVSDVKATIKLPGENEESVEFMANIPITSDTKINREDFADTVSHNFDEAFTDLHKTTMPTTTIASTTSDPVSEIQEENLSTKNLEKETEGPPIIIDQQPETSTKIFIDEDYYYYYDDNEPGFRVDFGLLDFVELFTEGGKRKIINANVEFIVNDNLDKPIVQSEVQNEVVNINIQGPADENNSRGFRFGFGLKLDRNGKLDRGHIQKQIEANNQVDLEEKANKLIDEFYNQGTTTTSETTTPSSVRVVTKIESRENIFEEEVSTKATTGVTSQKPLTTSRKPPTTKTTTTRTTAKLETTTEILAKTTKLEDDNDQITTTLKDNILDFLATGLETTTIKMGTSQDQEEENQTILSITNLIESMNMSKKNKSSTSTSSASLSPKNPIDISFYNSTSKTSFRLAVCLDGINCEDNARCKLVHQKCNEGMDVSMLPHRVRQKLSECSVDDILCHLTPNPDVYNCQSTYEKCIRIVVPSSFIPMVFSPEISTPPIPAITTKEPAVLNPMAIIEGLASMSSNKSTNVINELTSSVLEAIQNVTEGFVIEPLPGNVTISELLKDNNTLPIFQDFIILLNGTTNTKSSNDINLINPNSQPPFGIDLSNASVIFNPSSFIIGDHDSTNTAFLNPKLNQTLRESILDAIKDQVIICQHCNKTKSTTSNQVHIVDKTTPVDPQVELAICLKGVECMEMATCEKAQKLCIGEETYNQFNSQERISICECYVDRYICTLNQTMSPFCDDLLQECVKEKLPKISTMPKIFSVDGIVSQVAEDISNIVIDDKIPENIAITGINQDPTEDGSVSVEFEDITGSIVLTSSTPILQFQDNIGPVTVNIVKSDFEGKTRDEKKALAKERIEEVLRQIIVDQPVPSEAGQSSLADVIATSISGFVKENSPNEIPSQAKIEIKTSPIFEIPEIAIIEMSQGKITAGIKIPSPIEDTTVLNVPVPVIANDINEGSLAKNIAEALGDIEEQGDQDQPEQEQANLADVIATSISGFVNENTPNNVPSQANVLIKTGPRLEPEVAIEQISKDTISTNVKIPSPLENTTSFSVIIPTNNDNSNVINEINLAENIAEAIGTFFEEGEFGIVDEPIRNKVQPQEANLDNDITTSISGFVKEKVPHEPGQSSLAEVIATSISGFVKENSPDEIPNQANIKIKTSPNFEIPEIAIEEMSQGTITAGIKIPSPIEDTTFLNVPVPLIDNASKINEGSLAENIADALEKIDQQDNQVQPEQEQANLANVIATSITGFVNENTPNNVPSQANVLIETGPRLEPEIAIEQTSRDTIVSKVRIPSPLKNSTKISVTIPTNDDNSNIINEIDLAENIAEALGTFDEEEEFGIVNEPVASKEEPTLADFIADTVADFLEKSEEQIPDEISIKIQTKPNEVPEIAIEPNEEDESDLKAIVKLPGENEESVEFVADIPTTSDAKINREEFADTVSHNFDDAFSNSHKTVEQQVKTAIGAVVDSVDEFIKESNGDVPSKAHVNVNFDKDLEMIKVKVQEEDSRLAVEVQVPGENNNNKGEELDIILSIDENLELKRDDFENQLQAAIDSVGNLATPKKPNEVSKLTPRTDSIENKKESNQAIAQTITKTVDDIIQSNDSKEPPTTLVLNVAKNPKVEEIDVSIEEFDKIIIADIKSPGKNELKESFEVSIDEADELETTIESNLDVKDNEKNIDTVVKTVVEKVDDFIVNSEQEAPIKANVKVNFTEVVDETKVTVEQSDDKLQVDVEVPGKGDNFAIDVPIDENLNIETKDLEDVLLEVAIAPSFDGLNDESAGVNQENSNNKDIAQTIKKAVDQIVKSGNTNDTPSKVLVNVDKSPVIEEIDVAVEQFENVILANVKSPGIIEDQLHTVKIPINKINELESSIKNNLDVQEKENQDKSLVKKISDAVENFVQSDKSQLPRMVRIDIIKNKGFEDIDIAIQPTEGGVEIIQVVAQVPASDNVNITFTVSPNENNLPIEELDKVNLENDISKNLKVPIVNDSEIQKQVSMKVKEVASKNQIPETIVIEIEEENVFETKIDLEENSAKNDVKFNVKVPSSQDTIKLISIEVPKNKDNSGIDEKRLEQIINQEIATVQNVKGKEPFVMSIDEFGFTIATIKVDDADQVTKAPLQLTDVIGQEKSTEGSLDVMSMDEFGFTISVPVTSVTEKDLPPDSIPEDSENEVTAGKTKSSTPRALPSTSTKQNFVDKPFKETDDDNVTPVISRPLEESAEPQNTNEMKDDKVRPSTTQRALDTMGKDPSIVVQPSIENDSPKIDSKDVEDKPTTTITTTKSTASSDTTTGKLSIVDDSNGVLKTVTIPSSSSDDSNQIIAQTVSDAVDVIIKSNDSKDPPSKVVINVAKSPIIDEIDVSIEQFDQVILANITSPGEKEANDGLEIEINKNNDNLESTIKSNLDTADRNKVIAQTITELVDEITESKDASDQPSKIVINVAKNPEIEEIDVSIEPFDKVILANVTSPGIGVDTMAVEIKLNKIGELESDIETKLDEIEKLDPISTSNLEVEITSTKKTEDSTDSLPSRTTFIIEDEIEIDDMVVPTSQVTETKNVQSSNKPASSVQTDTNEDIIKQIIDSSTKPNELIAIEDLNQIEIDDKPSEVTATSLESNLNVVKPTTSASVAPSEELQFSSTSDRREETTPSTSVSQDDVQLSTSTVVPDVIKSSTTMLSSISTSSSKVTSAASITAVSTDPSTITTTDSITTIKSSTTTTPAPFFSTTNVLPRIRDLVVALVAGLIAQTVGFPFSPVAPARKDEVEGPSLIRPRPPNINIRDPFIRNQIKESEGAFDGNVFNLTIPVSPEEVFELSQEEIKENISNIVVEAFGPEARDALQNITVVLGDKDNNVQDGRIFIKAQAAPVETINQVIVSNDDRPKTPRLDDPILLPINPSISAKDPVPEPPTTTNPYLESIFIPPVSSTLRTTSASSRPIISTSRPTNIRIPPTSRPPTIPRIPSSTIRPRRPLPPRVTTDTTTATISPTVRFEISDAYFPSTSTPTTRTTISPKVDVFYDDSNGIIYPSDVEFIPPQIPPIRDDKPTYTFEDIDQTEFFVDVDDNKVFDSRLNFLGESSANIVEATVVEDLNYARSVRESRASIGIVTISSITVGVIALLAFAVIIFMALARRRRRKDEAATASSANMTPTQSRTTFSGTPIMAETPSVSGGFADDPLNTTGSSNIDPVMPIDGHQTIVSSYNEFMALGNETRTNIMNSLPSPQDSATSAAELLRSIGSQPSSPIGFVAQGLPPPLTAAIGPGPVPRTRDLREGSPLLFAPFPGNMHYP